MVRQLTAIMFTDMVGYTAQMQTNEHQAKENRDRHRSVLEAATAEHGGRILQFYGDGTLTVFQSAVAAVQCAIEVQAALTAMDPPIDLRIGVHTGDVVIEEDGIAGDGVNVAARIQGLGVAGSVLISGKVFDEVKNQPDIRTRRLGRFNLKNVRRPTQVYAIRGLPAPLPRIPTWPVIVIIGILLIIAGKLIWPPPELDDRRYAVLHFELLDSVQVGLLDGSRCQALLMLALSRWDDVTLVDAIPLRDRRLQREGRTTLEDAFEDAESQLAGRLIWGGIRRDGNSIRVEGALYDVASRTAIRQYPVSIDSQASAQDRMAEMADALLLGEVQTSEARESAYATRLLEALLLFDDGQLFLEEWKLQEAAAAFSDAAERDPGYVHAFMWRALVGLFQGEDYEGWRRHAAAAVQGGDLLLARDRPIARGLSHLSHERWQEPCHAFGQAVDQDSTVFRAWLGLATCLTRDPVVVRDPTSETGVSFRSSHEAGRRALGRALDLAPYYYNEVLAGLPGSLLDELWPIREGDYREGYLAGDHEARFGAHPELRGDTLAYVPRPMMSFSNMAFTPEVVAAIEQSKRERAERSESWLKAFPRRLAALHNHALALEAVGRIAETGDPLTSALDAIRAALDVVPADSAVALHVSLATVHVRLLIKEGRWSAAAALADEVLSDPPPERADALRALAGLAVLRGRGDRTAALLERTAPERTFSDIDRPILAPIQLKETASALEAYAALGGPEAAATDLLDRLQTEIESLVPEPDRARVTAALLRLSVNSYPEVLRKLPEIQEYPGNYLPPLFKALNAGDSARVRDGLDAAVESAGALAPGGAPPSVVLADVRLRVAVGDTAGAVRELDQMLASLRIQDQRLLDPTEAGPLVRSMALRAELAAARGRMDTTRRWADAVTSLWSDGDAFAAARAEAVGRLMEETGGS